MKVLLRYFYTFLIIIISSSACITPKLIRPAERYIDMKEQGLSTVHLPVRLTKTDIESTINKLITGVVYEDREMDGDDLMMRAVKREDITIEIDSSILRYQVPLDIWITKDVGLTNIKGEGSIIIDFETNYSVEQNWNLVTKTQITSFKWKKRPKIRFAFVDIPVKFIADKVMKRSKQVIGQTIDQQLSSKFNLRAYIQKAWDELQQPILVSAAYNLWVKVLPKHLSMAPVIVNEDLISTKILIQGHTNAFIGDKPDMHGSIPLPDFGFSQNVPDDFNIQLGTSISYVEAANLAKQHLVGETYNSGRRYVTIEDIELYGQADKLVINVLLSGSYTGSVYMVGRPVYNLKKNQIEFEDLQFELNTRDVLMQSVGWLFRKGLERRFKKEMKFPLHENLEEMKSLIRTALQNHEVNENVILSGELEDIEIHRTHLTETHIHALFFSKGKLNLLIRG